MFILPLQMIHLDFVFMTILDPMSHTFASLDPCLLFYFFSFHVNSIVDFFAISCHLVIPLRPNHYYRCLQDCSFQDTHHHHHFNGRHLITHRSLNFASLPPLINHRLMIHLPFP